MTSLFASLTESAAYAGTLVLLFAVAAVSSWVTRRAVDQNADTAPDTVRVEAPLMPSDILDATTPTQVTEYDTSETRTQCIEVPTWIARAKGPDSISPSDTAGARDLPKSTQGGSENALSTVRYSITPMTSGRPSLSVGTEQVTLSGYLPDGRGRQWTYDLPQDRWGVGLESDLTFAKWVQGTLTADVTRHAEWGPLDVQTRFGVGYGALVTNGTAQVSPVARAGFRIGYDW